MHHETLLRKAEAGCEKEGKRCKNEFCAQKREAATKGGHWTESPGRPERMSQIRAATQMQRGTNGCSGLDPKAQPEREPSRLPGH